MIYELKKRNKTKLHITNLKSPVPKAPAVEDKRLKYKKRKKVHCLENMIDNEHFQSKPNANSIILPPGMNTWLGTGEYTFHCHLNYFLFLLTKLRFGKAEQYW